MEAIQQKVSFRILLLLAVIKVSGTATLAQNFPECTISPAGPLTVTVGSSVSFTVIATDPDPGAIVTLESSGVPSGATMLPSLPTSGASGLSSTFTWRPTAAQIGSFEIDFFVLDNEFNLSFCSITIDVVPSANQPPVAADDAYSVDEDNTMSVPAPGVLSNDSDPEADPLSAVLATAPLNGLLSLNSDGSFTYTPSSNFNGTDSFTYQASDGSASSPAATVTITVNPVNDPPVAADDAYSVDEDNPLNVLTPGVLNNDSDVDGNPLSAVLVAGPSNGSLTLNADGSFNYAPNLNFNGMDGFSYKASDGPAFSTTANVAITVNPVNDPPVASNDAYSVDEDNTLNISTPGVLANDTDVDGNALTAVLVGGVSNGALTLNPDGSFSYMPNPTFSGSDGFTYRASDGTAFSSDATVAITVNPVEEPLDFCSLLSPIVTAVTDLADDSSIPKKVRKHIKGAAKHLEKALEDCGDGEEDCEDENDDSGDEEEDCSDEKTEKTFRQVEHGIAELERAIKRSEDSALDNMLQGFIDDLVALIQAETEATVAEALAVAGPDNKHVKKALKHLAKGQEKLSEGKIHRAIDEFIKAVRQATKALEGEESPDPLAEGNAVSSQGSGASATPLSYRLLQNYPNPFNPTTMISYELADESLVRLKVYDILGRELADLVHEAQMPGTYQVTFDAQGLPSGVYFYRLEVYNPETGEGRYLASQKMVLAK